MRTRRTYYKDYGIDEEDVKQIKERCTHMDSEEKELLWNAAIYSNPCIAKELYTSLEQQKTYRQMADIDYIPYNYEDFYGYQRLCLVIFRNLLIFAGKYKCA